MESLIADGIERNYDHFRDNVNDCIHLLYETKARHKVIYDDLQARTDKDKALSSWGTTAKVLVIESGIGLLFHHYQHNKAYNKNNRIMKKFIIALVACLIAIAPAVAQNRIVRSSVNLRAQSNTKSTVLDVIPQGARVYVVADLSSGWSQVVYNYQVGYVYSSYLTPGLTYTYTPSTRVRYYTNSAGQRVQSPTYYHSAPRGATARCVDGTYSFSRNRRGTCSHHGGVAQWL